MKRFNLFLSFMRQTVYPLSIVSVSILNLNCAHVSTHHVPRNPASTVKSHDSGALFSGLFLGKANKINHSEAAKEPDGEAFPEVSIATGLHRPEFPEETIVLTPFDTHAMKGFKDAAKNHKKDHLYIFEYSDSVTNPLKDPKMYLVGVRDTVPEASLKESEISASFIDSETPKGQQEEPVEGIISSVSRWYTPEGPICAVGLDRAGKNAPPANNESFNFDTMKNYNQLFLRVASEEGCQYAESLLEFVLPVKAHYVLAKEGNESTAYIEQLTVLNEKL